VRVLRPYVCPLLHSSPFRFTIEFLAGSNSPSLPSHVHTPSSSRSPTSSMRTPPSSPLKHTTNSSSRPGTPKLQTNHSTGVLYLVDLAGSESVRLTGSSGQRVKESGRINQSLLSLGRVIHSLYAQNASGVHSSHISYRDSKLTRLLQPVLTIGGRESSVWMICCLTFANW
jgi:hypothetical protein